MDETSCEPMDVDMSSNSTSAMDISYTDISPASSRCTSPKIISFTKVIKAENFDDLSFQNTKEKQLEKVKEKSSGKVKESSYRRNYFVIILVCLISIVSYNIFSYKCFEDFKFKLISNRLHTRLYGQTLAIENVIEFLDLQDNAKVLILYGGTGVGKTFMVSLLFEDFFNHTNIYHYSMTNLEKALTTESMFGVTLCETSIVIIDDITLDNEVSKYVRELIARSSNLKKSITIILIYNCANFDKQFMPNCPNNFQSELEAAFVDIDAQKKFIKFEPLAEDSLKKCIQHELGDTIDETDLAKMMRNFDFQRDGCKGVHQKTKYLYVI